MSALAASSESSTEPLVPKTASPSSHGVRGYAAFRVPATESPVLVAVGVKVTPLGVFDLTSTVVLPTL